MLYYCLSNLTNKRGNIINSNSIPTINLQPLWDCSQSGLENVAQQIKEQFLSKGCVQWIFDGIAAYKINAIIFDYWPDGTSNNSKCFKRVFDSLNEFIPEQIQGLLSTNELQKLCKAHLIKDVSLQEVENELSMKNGEKPQFINQDEFIPVRLRLATAGEKLSNNNV